MVGREVDLEYRRRRDKPDIGKKRLIASLRGHPREELMKAGRIGLRRRPEPANDGLWFRGYDQSPAVDREIQRLDAEPIAASDEASSGEINDEDRPHAVEAAKATRPPLPIRGQRHFGVSRGTELVAAVPQLYLQFRGVVDFAIQRDPVAAVRGSERLYGMVAEILHLELMKGDGQSGWRAVHLRRPFRRPAHRTVAPNPKKSLSVGAPMTERRVACRQSRSYRKLVATAASDGADPTHVQLAARARCWRSEERRVGKEIGYGETK